LVLSAAVSTAAVYNTRAYGNKEVKISVPDGVKTDASDKQMITVTAPADINFTASVTGVTDTAVTWEIITKPGSTVPASSDASITDGHFTTNAPDTYKILARSNYDPKMADSLDVRVEKKK
jgi:hypothetical protein